MNFKTKSVRVGRLLWLVGTLIVATFLLGTLSLGLYAQDEAVSDLSGSHKSVSQDTAEPGESLLYTIFITNTGIGGNVPVTMTDVLPSGLIYQDSTFHPPVIGIPTEFGYENGVLTWIGTLGSGGYVQIDLMAQVDPDFPLGESITNTAVVLGLDEVYNLTAVTLITYTAPTTTTIYLPIIFKPIPTPQISASAPNANNAWTISWTNLGPQITDYELQEAKDNSFTNPITYNIAGDASSRTIQKTPSVDNRYYYRLRAQVGGQSGPWSNVVMVTGNSPQPTLSSTRPNSNNQWTLSWNSLLGATGYQLQEAQNPNFNNATTYNINAPTTSRQIQRPISWNNGYYYRIRGVAGTIAGSWSPTVQVIAGYRDDFNDPSSGWALRRTSYLEKTFAYYGSGTEAGYYIIIVDDRWDWMAASPLRRAPSVPYAIEYRARVHDASNLVSGGFIFAGDWNGGPCPDYSNIYQFTTCFNRFYNLNFIFYGPLKLLHEQVDELVWCPTCGGSLLKRLGPTIDAGDMLPNGPSKEWHTYRVEVREDGARLFIDGSFRSHFTDTTYFNQAYFAVFASTDEYKPSIWFYDYVQVTPLD